MSETTDAPNGPQAGAETPSGGASGTQRGSGAAPGPQRATRRFSAQDALEWVLSRDPDDECWPWQGRRDRKGYGLFDLNRRARLAHRWVYEHFTGPIPEGLLILHSCDNPPCVNPRHLRAGTHLDNMKDRSERKRSAQQRRTHCTKGHPYDEVNTLWKTSPTRAPYRQCRACRQIACNERNARIRAEARQARQDGAPPADLSPALLETLWLTAAGMVRGQVAAALGISVDAVDTRRSEIYLKLRVDNKRQAVERALQLGLLPAGGSDA